VRRERPDLTPQSHKTPWEQWKIEKESVEAVGVGWGETGVRRHYPAKSQDVAGEIEEAGIETLQTQQTKNGAYRKQQHEMSCSSSSTCSSEEEGGRGGDDGMCVGERKRDADRHKDTQRN